MTTPDLIVTVTAYAVSVLPADHRMAPYATLRVRIYGAPGSGWVVENHGEFLHPGPQLRGRITHPDAVATLLMKEHRLACVGGWIASGDWWLHCGVCRPEGGQQ